MTRILDIIDETQARLDQSKSDPIWLNEAMADIRAEAAAFAETAGNTVPEKVTQRIIFNATKLTKRDAFATSILRALISADPAAMSDDSTAAGIMARAYVLADMQLIAAKTDDEP
jgi:anti-sigma factor RsiW